MGITYEEEAPNTPKITYEERRAAPKSKPRDATLMQKVQASAPGRFIQGLRDSIDAGAQTLSNVVPESVTNVLDIPGKALRESNSPFLQTVGETLFADPRAAATDKRIRETEAQYEAARQATAPRTLSGQITGQEDAGFDAWRFGGNVFSPTNAAIAARLPAAALSTGWRMAGTGAGLGAVGGVLTPVNEEKAQADFASTKGAQVGLNTVTGAVLTPVLGKIFQAATPYIQRAIDKLSGQSEISMARASLETDNVLRRALSDMGQTLEDIPKAQMAELRQQVNLALRQGKTLDAAAILRKKDFQAEGLPSTLGQIARDPLQFAKERNLRGVPGVGEPLMQVFDAQNKGIQKGYGAFSQGASDSVTAGEKLASALRSTDASLRGGVTRAYKAARESAGKDLEVPLQGLAQDAAKVVEDFADKVPTAIRNKLDSFGILSGKNQTKVFTFDEADKLLKSINDHVGADKATNTALSQLRDSVKRAMLESGDDAFAGARAAAASRFKLHEAIPALEAASEGAAPDAFVRKFVLNGNAGEVRTMAALLRKEAPEAFQEARSQIGAQLQRAAFGENTAGDKIMSPERLAKTLREVGRPKLEAFFTASEIEQMHRLSRIGAYVNSSPAAAPVSSSNSNIASMVGNYAQRIPGGIGATVALLRAAGQPIANQRTVSNAIAAQIPSQSTAASPEAIRKAALAAALTSYAGGQAVAPR